MATSIDPEVYESRIREWAKAQCEDNEIAGSLVIECGLTREAAEATVEAMADELKAMRWHGRREMRSWVYRIAQDSDAQCKINGAQIQILGMWAKAHLGYAKDGIDEKTRKIIAEAERAARTGPRGLVPKKSHG